MSEKPSRELRGALRRQRIIDTARTLFIDRGFHSTGIAAIAKASDVAVAQLYRDFPAKEDIVAAIVQYDCHLLINSVELKAAVRTQDRPAARTWLTRLFLPIENVDHDRLFIEIIAEVSRNPRIALVFKTLETDLREHLLEALTLLAPGHGLDDARSHLADLVMTLCLGLLHHRLMNASDGRDQMTRDVIDIVDTKITSLANRSPQS